MCIILITLLSACQAYHGFEMATITHQIGYDAQVFKGIITIVPHCNSILLWKCPNVEQGQLDTFTFNLEHQGVVLNVMDFEQEYSYKVEQYPTIVLTYRDHSKGVLKIEYESLHNSEYSESLKWNLANQIEQELMVDWDSTHHGMTGMAEYLNNYCDSQLGVGNDL